LKPDLSSVTFVEMVVGGYSTKSRVRDGAGKEWVVKVGKEAQPETAATRLMWAMGYTADINYLVPRVETKGKGAFENARFEARLPGINRFSDRQLQDAFRAANYGDEDVQLLAGEVRSRINELVNLK